MAHSSINEFGFVIVVFLIYIKILTNVEYMYLPTRKSTQLKNIFIPNL